jgi:hypothetical protein
VTFQSNGRGTIMCGGTSTEFDGRVSLRFEAYELPSTCLVTISGARGVFQVYTSGSVTCNEAGGEVACSPAAVQ